MNEPLAGSCAHCAQPVADAAAVLLGGKRTCAACRDVVLAGESAPGGLARLVAASLAAAVAGAALWAAAAAAAGGELGFAALGVGAAVAGAARLASGGRRGPRLQKAAAACALLGFLLGKLFLVAYALRELAESAPGRPPGLLVFFARVFPRMLAADDALWLLAALAAAWLALRPSRIAPVRAPPARQPSAPI